MATALLTITAGSGTTLIQAIVGGGSIKLTAWNTDGEGDEQTLEIEGGSTVGEVLDAVAGAGNFDGTATVSPALAEASIATLIDGFFLGTAPASSSPTFAAGPSIAIPITY